MKKKMTVATIAMLILVGMLAMAYSPVAHTEADPFVIDLYTWPDAIPVGTVTVAIDGENLVVTLETINGWMMLDTHLYLDPTTPPTWPPPWAEFPYKHEGLGEVTTDAYIISLTSLGVGSNDILYISTHANLVFWTDYRPIYRDGWGEQNPFEWYPVGWKKYFTYTVQLEILFMVNGHKYNYRDGTGLEGWTIELYKDGEKIDETQTGPDGYYEFVGIGPGDYKVCEVNKTNEGWAPFGPTCYEFIVDDNNGGDHTFDFYNYKMLPTHALTETSDYRCELPWFNVIFTPLKKKNSYKLSSTNPGSFYFNVVKYGTPGTDITVEVILPPDEANGFWYDSPNFILHHIYIGSTPVVDIHVYEGRESPTDWVPEWSTDVTNDFDIDAAPDGKHATIEGIMPDTGEVFVTVHIDYQISASLTADQVDMFSGFEYTFGAKVYFSAFGVTSRIRINM